VLGLLRARNVLNPKEVLLVLVTHLSHLGLNLPGFRLELVDMGSKLAQARLAANHVEILSFWIEDLITF
jgi:hypothetical protein